MRSSLNHQWETWKESPRIDIRSVSVDKCSKCGLLRIKQDGSLDHLYAYGWLGKVCYREPNCSEVVMRKVLK